MTTTRRVMITGLGLLAVTGCASNSDVISEQSIQEARAEHEEQKQRQIHDEYWQAQMARQEAIQAARERARERQEMMRRETE